MQDRKPNGSSWAKVSQVEGQTKANAWSICARARTCSTTCPTIVRRKSHGQTYHACQNSGEPVVPGSTICPDSIITKSS